MADLRTYTGLQAAVADYLGRDDLAERIPTFIALAEQRMNRELRLRIMERRTELAVQPWQYAIPLPWQREPGHWDVFMEMRDLVFCPDGGTTQNLHYVPPESYGVGKTVGLPRAYTIIGHDIFLIPASYGAGTLKLTYYAEIPPLGEQQPSNDILLMFPDVYLYAALVESGPFTRGSAPLELWTQYYSAAKQKVTSNEQRGRFTANLSMRPARSI